MSTVSGLEISNSIKNAVHHLKQLGIKEIIVRMF